MFVIETPVSETKNTETKKELPVFRTAETILKACLVDIDEGRWACHVLHHKTAKRTDLGCAVGLIGINSGSLGHRDSVYEYPWQAATRGRPWSQGAISALALLAETSGRGKIRNGFDPVTDTVTYHNDKLNLVEARAWFERTLVLAKERGL